MSDRRGICGGGAYVCVCILAAWHGNFLPSFRESLLVGVDGSQEDKNTRSLIPSPGSLVWANPMLPPGMLALEGELRNHSFIF